MLETIFSAFEEKYINSFIEKKDKQQDILDEWTVQIKNAITAGIINPDNPKKEVNEIMLQKLSLPSFIGQIHEWLNFKDLFIISIPENANLSLFLMLKYLKLSCHWNALK